MHIGTNAIGSCVSRDRLRHSTGQEYALNEM